jgi:hypothetical protein
MLGGTAYILCLPDTLHNVLAKQIISYNHRTTFYVQKTEAVSAVFIPLGIYTDRAAASFRQLYA